MNTFATGGINTLFSLLKESIALKGYFIHIQELITSKSVSRRKLFVRQGRMKGSERVSTTNERALILDSPGDKPLDYT